MWAKGFIPIAGEGRSFADRLTKSTIGVQQQGAAFATVPGSELAPLVTQGAGGARPDAEARGAMLLALLGRLKLDAEDLAVAHVAKTIPTSTWAQARDTYRSHTTGQGVSQ